MANYKILRKLFACLVAVILGLTLISAGPGHAHAASASPHTPSLLVEYTTIINEAGITGAQTYCLGITNGSTQAGTPAIVWECNANLDQLWFAQHFGNYYRLVNKNDGQCLGFKQGTKQEGATPIQWPCNSNYDQQWTVQIKSTSPLEYRLINRNDGFCLGVNNGIVQNNTKPVQWACNGNADQYWVSIE